MDIIFRSSKLQKACSSERESNRQWGAENAKKIRQRLADLEAAETLADMGALPPARCHELKGDRTGQFAVDLRHPLRLIRGPTHPQQRLPVGRHRGRAPAHANPWQRVRAMWRQEP